MVVTRKHNGTPRRTVDISPLNKHCKRETFPTESPFHLTRRVAKGTCKTVSDPGTAIIASPSVNLTVTSQPSSLRVNLTVTSQPSSLRSDDGDTRGLLKAFFPRVTATSAASMRYYLTLSARNVVWTTPYTEPCYRPNLNIIDN